MLFIPSFKVFSVFLFSCFTQFGGTSLSLNIFDKFRNAAPLKWPIWRLRTKKDIFFFLLCFFFLFKVPKEVPFVSVNEQEVTGEWNNPYHNSHPSTVWISFLVVWFVMQGIYVRSCLFSICESCCFSWSLSPRCININDPYSVAHKRIRKRGCLHGVGGPQVGEVTRLSGVKKNNRRLYAILQPRHLKKATCFGG